MNLEVCIEIFPVQGAQVFIILLEITFPEVSFMANIHLWYLHTETQQVPNNTVLTKSLLRSQT